MNKQIKGLLLQYTRICYGKLVSKLTELVGTVYKHMTLKK